MNTADTRILFLIYKAQWPPVGGGDMRTFGLLKEISERYNIDLFILSKKPISKKQIELLKGYSDTITYICSKSTSIKGKILIIKHMIEYTVPYHCADIFLSLKSNPGILKKIRSFTGIVYASYGHWGTIAPKDASNWILDQHNADVHFWKVYASQSTNLILKIAAIINWRLANTHFRKIYPRIGRIISVCKEDKQLTLNLCPNAKVDIIDNGVDCSMYIPKRELINIPPRILFTGTSVPRNMTALRQFVSNVFPLIEKKLPDIELLVAGNFHSRAQSNFKKYKNIHFTGYVDDIKPFFNQSLLYIAPFRETHGSKLKIAEAMSMSMCIVSTPKGVRGFHLVDRESVFISHNDNEFAELVVSLLKDREKREKVGSGARVIAQSTIDWKILGTILFNIIDSTIIFLNRHKYL